MAVVRILAVLTALTAPAAVPMFMQPQPIPAKRIIANLEKRIARIEKRGRAGRDDLAELHYKLARTHYLALINRSTLVPAYPARDGAEPAPDHLAEGFLSYLRDQEASRRAKKALGFDDETKMDADGWKKLAAERRKQFDALKKAKWMPPSPDSKQLHRHAEQAMVHFERAIAADGTTARYRLGRASLAEQVLDLERKEVLTKRAMIKPLAAWSYEKVRDAYFAAFELALPGDLEWKRRPLEGLSGFVSYEAGHAYLRLAKKSDALGKGQEEKIEKVRAAVKKLTRVPRGAITPILLGATPGAQLADLLDPKATAVFDLDGDGGAERWPWVRRDTRILVWDPGQRGRIASGRQLFGSVTFFLLHRNGYDALALLDDDLDGELTDLELEGIAVWTDANGDGRSTPGEVVSAGAAGIAAIATGARRDGGVLTSRRGVRYRDGSVVPTFDWVTSPAAASAR